MIPISHSAAKLGQMMASSVTSISNRIVATTITVTTSSLFTTTSIIHTDLTTITPTSTITSTITLATTIHKTRACNQGPSTDNSCKLFTFKLATKTVLSPSCTHTVQQCVTLSDKVNSTDVSLTLGTDSRLGNDAISALSALLGMSIVVLTIVTAGWIWTCWRLRKRGGMEINSKINR